ncbi:TetR/AcrR family transcriptional regulator [Streptomyces sp. NPDC001530]|uniref:TetR/AcrR family transcriptional regulator n=1 Tax=Streptomyces sp. NPDC001530 TaxID=3364582 RepID=UPI00369016CE
MRHDARENAPVAGKGSAEGRAEGRKPVGRPRRIEARQIVDAARRIIQEEGVDAVSMRRVAKEVGTTPMALYHHVRDKDELLMLTLSGMAATVPRPALPDDPRERVLATAVHMHAVLRGMPWVVEVLGLGDLTDKGALWMVEEIIASAVACGLTPDEAVRAYRTIWYCVYGDLVFRRAVDRRTAEPDRKRYFPALLSDEDAAELPHLTALADRWEQLTEAYDVREQLAAVVTGLLSA